MIRLDPGTRHVLATCRECPSWREIHPDRFAALEAGAWHMTACHGDSHEASKLRHRAAILRA